METGTREKKRALPGKITAALTLFALALTGGAGMAAGQPVEPQSLEMAEATEDFAPRIEAFIDRLSLEREAFIIRAHRCDGRPGEMHDNIYYVWIGMRGVAPDSDAADLLESLHDSWQAQGWDVFRYRHLDNGGVNVAARDPATGDAYSLDSGFAADPDRYIVGYFNTPCFKNPAGAVRFGPVEISPSE